MKNGKRLKIILASLLAVVIGAAALAFTPVKKVSAEADYSYTIGNFSVAFPNENSLAVGGNGKILSFVPGSQNAFCFFYDVSFGEIPSSSYDFERRFYLKGNFLYEGTVQYIELSSTLSAFNNMSPYSVYSDGLFLFLRYYQQDAFLIAGETYEIVINTCWMSYSHISQSATYYYMHGEILELPDPGEREHYIFVGWYMDVALTQPYDGRPIYEDTVLFAKWQIKQYLITYVTNSFLVIESQEKDALIFFEPPEISKIGHIFKGWYTDEALTQEYSPSLLVGNLILYASWAVRMLTVTFIVEGVVFKEMEVPYGTSLSYAQSQANMPLYMVTLVSFEDGIVEQDSNELLIKGNAVVTAQKLSATQTIDTIVKNYWLTGLLGIAVIALVIALLTRNGKRKVRRG